MSIRISLAQLNVKVGDFKGNLQKIKQAIQVARDQEQAELIIFPELAITGYPPEDLLLREDFCADVDRAMQEVVRASKGIIVMIGHPHRQDGKLFNSVSWIQDQSIRARYDKQALPNYGLFDERRYFTPGSQPCVVEYQGVRFGLLVCEDVWEASAYESLATLKPDVVLSINASPYSLIKHGERINILQKSIHALHAPLVYVNMVGGQDDWLFDGDSMVLDSKGDVVLQLPSFKEKSEPVVFNSKTNSFESSTVTETTPLQNLYEGLVLSVRDYIEKNRFPGVLIGLSGGIDSALTLCIAVDALGADRVRTIMMPSEYTANMSIEDAKLQAKTLGVHLDNLPINKLFQQFTQHLSPIFLNTTSDKTEENLQARIRGTLLMAVSNKFGYLVLTTSNKSEMAVGYSTLYGDMVGGFAVLKDVYKTKVYELARYRNTVSRVIPERVITRPPSAELAPNQQDQDSLPPYDVLDAIINAYVDCDLSCEHIIDMGYERSTVERVIRLIHLSEYKRRQAPIGPRVTTRSFYRERRYPITFG